MVEAFASYQRTALMCRNLRGTAGDVWPFDLLKPTHALIHLNLLKNVSPLKAKEASRVFD